MSTLMLPLAPLARGWRVVTADSRSVVCCGMSWSTLAVMPSDDARPGRTFLRAVPLRPTGSVRAPSAVENGAVNVTVSIGIAASMATAVLSVVVHLAPPDVEVQDHPLFAVDLRERRVEPAGRPIVAVSSVPAGIGEPPVFVASIPNDAGW